MRKDTIIRVTIFLLFFCSAQQLNAQDGIIISEDYEQITFLDLVNSLSSDDHVRFFYDHSIDTLVLSNIKKGSSIERVIMELPSDIALKVFVDGRDVYIYSGKEIISSLPAYNFHVSKKVQISEDDTEEGQYLKTISISSDKLLTVGRKDRVVRGKKCLVHGKVRSAGSGEELIGATIYVKELQLGTATDVNGSFKFRIAPGLYTIAVNHMAMKEEELGIEVLSDGLLTLDLDEDMFEIQEIQVVDKRRGNVEGMLMGFERISTDAMKEIPVVMGEKDILKVAQMLPGVQNVGEGSSGFNVRGGSPDQNMFYLNNISVYNTSHLFGFFTAFSPDIISDFSLYKNNIPAKYGGRIASIFEINTRDGDSQNFFAHGGISPITGHFSVEGPVVKDKVSFVASARSTYSDWLLKRIKNSDIKDSDASFYDGSFELNGKINENNKLKAFVYHSSDVFQLASRNDYSYTNLGTSLAWNHKFSSSFSNAVSLASSRYDFENIDKNNVSEAYTQDYRIEQYDLRADFLKITDNHRFEFGWNSVFYDLNRGSITPYGEESSRMPLDLGQEKGLENAAYLSDEFNLHQRLHLLLGLRYSFYNSFGPTDVTLYEEGYVKNEHNIIGTEHFEPWESVKFYDGFEPRAALNYHLAQNSSIKASYNRLHQYVFLLSNTIALAPNDQWKLCDYHTTPPRSDQISLGYYQDFTDAGINFSLEVYKKWINNVVEYKDGVDFISGDPIEALTLQGKQDTKGLELMLKKNSNRLTGWLSYTYSRSIVTVKGENDALSLNSGEAFPSNYDRPHGFNLVANYRVSRRVSFSSNVVYTSGRPVTLPIAVYYSENQQYLYYSSRNAYRIPDYFRVDFSVNLEGNLKFRKVAHSYWMLNIYNLTGRDNAYSVFYEARNGNIQGYSLSVFAQPIVTLSWNFKFGNYNSD